MSRKQSSSRLSKLATRYSRLTGAQLVARTETLEDASRIAADVRSLAASVLSQDETPAPRRPGREGTGR